MPVCSSNERLTVSIESATRMFTALVRSTLATASVHLTPAGSRPWSFFREAQNRSASETVDTGMICMCFLLPVESVLDRLLERRGREGGVRHPHPVAPE